MRDGRSSHPWGQLTDARRCPHSRLMGLLSDFFRNIFVSRKHKFVDLVITITGLSLSFRLIFTKLFVDRVYDLVQLIFELAFSAFFNCRDLVKTIDMPFFY